jgi:RNA methyltransferase, TrmH family
MPYPLMITSRANPRIKEIRLLKQGKHRRERGEFFVEGARWLEEVLQSPGPIVNVVWSPRLLETPRGPELLRRIQEQTPEGKWLPVTDAIMESLSETKSHQGVLAVLKMREPSWEDLLQREGLIVILHELQDPGNLGTIFRVAEAAGAAGLVLSQGALDPYNPKVVRASMGSLLRLPFLLHQNMDDALKMLRSRGYRILVADAHAGLPFWNIDFSSPTAILLGQEGAGIPPSLIQAADETFSIPMKPPVESLNVGMAAGLVLYEALRQRKAGRN